MRKRVPRRSRTTPGSGYRWASCGRILAIKSGALDAVKHGLELEPGDYEFLTLKKEIKAGATLEQMLCHWIDPGADQTLQQGTGREMRMINSAP